jgi:hypothetical protein
MRIHILPALCFGNTGVYAAFSCKNRLSQCAAATAGELVYGKADAHVSARRFYNYANSYSAQR